MCLHPVADLRRRPEGAMAPLREETAIKKVHKLLLEGAKIITLILILTYDGLIFLVGLNLTKLVRQHQVW